MYGIEVALEIRRRGDARRRPRDPRRPGDRRHCAEAGGGASPTPCSSASGALHKLRRARAERCRTSRPGGRRGARARGRERRRARPRSRASSRPRPPRPGKDDAGRHRYAPRTKAEAEGRGVHIVQQELNLIGTLSVAENLFFGRLPTRLGIIARDELRKRAKDVLALVGLVDLDPTTPVERLGVSYQKLVEIATALARDARVLILDEPTAALAEPQVENLFENVRRLASRVSASSTSAIVWTRRGVSPTGQRCFATAASSSLRLGELSEDQIVQAMTGREVARESRHRPRELGATRAPRGEARPGTALLRRHLRGAPGRNLGLSGLMGSGRSSLLRAIFGAERADAGGVALGADGPLVRFREPRQATPPDSPWCPRTESGTDCCSRARSH